MNLCGSAPSQQERKKIYIAGCETRGSTRQTLDDTSDLPDKGGDGEDRVVDCIGNDDPSQVLRETTTCPIYDTCQF